MRPQPSTLLRRIQSRDRSHRDLRWLRRLVLDGPFWDAEYKPGYTTILGHMTGRQLLRRPGYDVDIDAILTACAKHGVAVEINANPWRLDLD